MYERITLSGMGGQGIILLGNLIGTSAMFENRFVTIVPSYGAEMRGGISNCFVTLSDKMISSPVFQESDTGILFYQLAMEKYGASIRKGGTIIFNENMVFQKVKRDDVKFISIPANEKAEEIGDIRVVNIILAGIWWKKRKMIKFDSAIKAIEEIFKIKGKKIIDLNKEAFNFGYNFVK